MSLLREARRTVLIIVIVSLVSFFFPTSGQAQAVVSGNIAGIVRDTTGAVLPGVTVTAESPALIEKVRTVVTDEQGRYQIVDLRPGTYLVTFALSGFSTVKRDGVVLTAGFTAPVNAELRVGALEETVTVAGGSPVVDTLNVRAQNVLSNDTLDVIPTGKTIPAYAALTLGASAGLASQDVGGNRGELPTAISIHGNRGTDQRLLLDGMPFNHIANQGGGTGRHFFIDQEFVQEVVLETGGQGAESPSGGVIVNAIPKDGGNIFSGSFTGNYTGPDLQADNLDDTLRARGVKALPGIKKVYDIGGSFGGPLKKDHLWFFVASRWWGSSEYVPNAFFNKTPHTLFYTPDTSRPAYSDTPNRDHSLRLTWQAAAKDKITFNTSFQQNCLCYDFVSATSAPEANGHMKYPPRVWQTSWTHTASNRLLMQGGFSYVNSYMDEIRPDETSTTDIAITDQSGFSYGARSGLSVLSYGRLDGSNVNGRFTTSYVTGSHSFKTGVYALRGFPFRRQEMNDPPISYTFRNCFTTGCQPVSVTYYAAPHEAKNYVNDLGLYAQDQWTLKKLTVNLGVRYDSLHSYVPEQTRPAGPFVAALHVDKVDNVPNWKDINPRLGIAYDLFGNGKTAVKASIGRFVATEGSIIAVAANPASQITLSASRIWTDNGDFIPQESELGPLSNSAFGTVNRTTSYADDVLTGWGVRTYSWQGQVSISHELRPGVALNGGYYRTSYGNFTVTDNLKQKTSDYDPFCVTAPANVALPNGGGYPVCGLYDLKPTVFGQTDNLITQATNFGKQTEVFNGLEVGISTRLRGGVLLAGGVSTGQTVTDICAVTIDSPDKRFCHTTNPWRGQTQYKLNGSYPLPWRFQASAVFQNLPGLPVQANRSYTNAEVLPSLGRDLGSCGGRTPCTGTVLVSNLIEPNTVFENRLTQLDVRLTRAFKVQRLRVRASADLYNVFNANTILAENATYGTTWRLPSRVLGGRLAKFGAQLDF